MFKAIKIIALVCVLSVVAVVVGLIAIGSAGPETSIYPGQQIPKEFMTTIRSLSLLQEGEQIKYFYSDAFMDIKHGLYFVTDQNLALYSDEWEQPKRIIPLAEIALVDADWSDSEWVDSDIHVTTKAGDYVGFPLSSEKGLDKRFVELLKAKLPAESE